MKKYDLIFSIGEACSCTSALRLAKLQFKSYPLDWLFGSDFIGRCKILASQFEHFIGKNKKNQQNCRIYQINFCFTSSISRPILITSARELFTKHDHEIRPFDFKSKSNGFFKENQAFRPSIVEFELINFKIARFSSILELCIRFLTFPQISMIFSMILIR